MKSRELKLVKDGMKKFHEAMEALAVSNVLVGIPAEENERQGEDEEQEMNNATIGYINENGSELAGIPARPHLIPGVKKVSKEVAEEFKKAALAAFNDPKSVTKFYTRAGIIASNSVKKVITEQEGFEPLAESTLAARKASGAKGDKALIRTGQYRNAITFVIEGKE